MEAPRSTQHSAWSARYSAKHSASGARTWCALSKWNGPDGTSQSRRANGRSTCPTTRRHGTLPSDPSPARAPKVSSPEPHNLTPQADRRHLSATRTIPSTRASVSPRTLPPKSGTDPTHASCGRWRQSTRRWTRSEVTTAPRRQTHGVQVRVRICWKRCRRNRRRHCRLPTPSRAQANRSFRTATRLTTNAALRRSIRR